MRGREKWGPCERGYGLGESKLRRRRSEFGRDSVIRVPLTSASVHIVLIIPRRAMGVEASHDNVVITEVKKRVKVWCEIGGTAGYRGDVNVMKVDGDIFEGGCNGEVLSN